MARSNWFDDTAEHPGIEEQLTKLESFTSALADGMVTATELNAQEERLMAAMKKVEGELNDDQHALVTLLLIELSGYNVMRLLHELQTAHSRLAFDKT
jgi:hypothetical protein